MELIFKTSDGIQLYATIENDEIKSFHSINAYKIKMALKKDLYSKDSYSSYMAKILLNTIKRIGIERIND